MKIAVVIPALDEAHYIAAAIESASCPGVEVVVVDGGSGDATAERAREAGARVLAADHPGRSFQLRCGAEATAGDALVFLHADTRLPRGWVAAVEGALQDPRVAGGAFRLRFDEPGAGLRLLEWGVRLRVALLRLPYGDQGLFVRRSVLEEVGGVPAVEFMEDLDLVRAIRSRGRLALLPLPATTSARRYRREGLLRTVARHLLAQLAWSLGVDRGRVRSWVRR